MYFSSCLLSPMSRNSVSEELRVKRLAVIQEEICCILKVSNVCVEVRWMKGEEELSVICIKMVVERKGDESAKGSGVHDEEQRVEYRTQRNTARKIDGSHI